MFRRLWREHHKGSGYPSVSRLFAQWIEREIAELRAKGARLPHVDPDVGEIHEPFRGVSERRARVDE